MACSNFVLADVLVLLPILHHEKFLVRDIEYVGVGVFVLVQLLVYYGLEVDVGLAELGTGQRYARDLEGLFVRDLYLGWHQDLLIQLFKILPLCLFGRTFERVGPTVHLLR